MLQKTQTYILPRNESESDEWEKWLIGLKMLRQVEVVDSDFKRILTASHQDTSEESHISLSLW